MEGEGALLHSLEHFLTHMVSPAQLCQAFFVTAAAGVLAVAATPESARRLLLEYGPRQAKTPSAAAAPTGDEDDVPSKASTTSSSNHFTELIAWFTSMGKVPHSWFKHFYILSVCSSLFWAAQYVSNGAILTFLVRTQAESLKTSMTTNQAVLTWLLMSMQGCRRLYECFAILRPSTSKMWIVHWVLGMAYYACINVSVWIEASSSLLQTGEFSFEPVRPSAKEAIGTLLFLVAWTVQYRCHKYLAGLKKYSLPEDGMFAYLICPHYTCECLLYLSLAITAAPKDQLFNQTIICGLLFVSTNLGVTAGDTRKWYAEKFGSDSIHHRWNMVPLVY